LVSGGNLRGSFFSFGPAELPGRLVFYWGHLIDNLHWGLLVAAMVGFVALCLWDRPVAGLLGFLFFGWVFYSIENDIPDIEVYFIPSYLLLALAAAVGFGLLLTEAEDILDRSSRAPQRLVLGVLSVALVLLPITDVANSYARNDRSDDYRGQEIIEDVAKYAAPNATILHQRSNLWYMVLVEKRRRDLTLVAPFWHNRNVRYADIVWPDDLDLPKTNRRYGTNDFSGVTAAKIAAKKGPVYVIRQEDINLKGLHEAGFRKVHVRGVLYELIAPGDVRSANVNGVVRE
jgi:hypothetical protein